MKNYLSILISWKPILTFLVSFILCFLIWDSNNEAHRRFIQIQFEKDLNEFALKVQNELDANLEVIEIIRKFHDSVSNFNQLNFTTFSKKLLSRRHSIQALEWAPKVNFEDLKQTEELMVDAGYKTFFIKEKNALNQLVPVSDRKWYFPVLYVVPFIGNQEAHGFDIASNYTRSKSLAYSGETGRMTVTKKLVLVQDSSQSNSFLAFTPVYERGKRLKTNRDRSNALKGYFIGVYRIEALIDETLDDYEHFSDAIYLFDVTSATEQPEFLGFRGLKQYEQNNYQMLDSQVNGILRFETYLHVPGRIWKMTVLPSEKFLAQYIDISPSVTLFFGVLISSLASILAALYLSSELKSKEILKKNKKLTNAYKELEQFSYIASHDLKEPLRTMRTFCRHLVKDMAKDDKARIKEDLEFIEKSAHRMTILVEDLLNLSRASNNEINKSWFSVHGCIRQAMAQLEISIDESEAEVVFEGYDSSVYADESLLEHVFLNVLNNAIKFRKEGVPPLIVVNCVQKPTSNAVCIIINDNGIGIERENLSFIFEAFQRFHPSSGYEGTGIGLAIVKKVIKRHQGSVYVNSEVGVGTEVMITLPESRRG